MDPFEGMILLCWAIFLAVWGITALYAKRSTRFGWRFMLLRAILLLVVLALLQQKPAHVSFIQHAPGAVRGGAGVALCALGIALAIWARLHLGRNWGMPMARKEDPELITSGPYAYVRNPIYTGVILAVAGSALVAGFAWLILAVIVAVFFVYSALQEEKDMAREFPDSYPAYKARTKRLVPFVF